MRFIVVALFLLILISSCARVDFQVLRLDDFSTVGELKPPFFGKYRDLFIGADPASNQLAVIVWGDYSSTLRIVTLEPWCCMEHRVPVGRLNGLEGPMAFDFQRRRFLYSTGNKIYSCSPDGTLESCRIALREDYRVSRILTSPEGIFVLTQKSRGDYRGFSVVKLSFALGASEEFFHSKLGVWAIGLSAAMLHCLVRTESRPSRWDWELLSIDTETLARTRYPFEWRGRIFRIMNGELLALSLDEQRVCRMDLEVLRIVEETIVPPHEGSNIYGVAGCPRYILFVWDKNRSPQKTLMVRESSSGETRKLFIDKMFSSSVRILDVNGRSYAVLHQ